MECYDALRTFLGDAGWPWNRAHFPWRLEHSPPFQQSRARRVEPIRYALLQGRERGDALSANTIGFSYTAEVRILERDFMRLAEHGALEKSDDPVRFVVDQQNFHRQLIMRQRGQFVLRVLKTA